MFYGSWYWWGFPFLWILFFWVLMSWLWGGRRRRYWRDQNPDSTARRDPLDYAKERYAKGEITHTELEEIRKNLSK